MPVGLVSPAAATDCSGGDATIYLSDRWALNSAFNYLIPQSRNSRPCRRRCARMLGPDHQLDVVAGLSHARLALQSLPAIVQRRRQHDVPDHAEITALRSAFDLALGVATPNTPVSGRCGITAFANRPREETMTRSRHWVTIQGLLLVLAILDGAAGCTQRSAERSRPWCRWPRPRRPTSRQPKTMRMPRRQTPPRSLPRRHRPSAPRSPPPWAAPVPLFRSQAISCLRPTRNSAA